MGIDWMILRPKRKKYLTLPKRGEWSNDLWKIWDILQDLEHGEKLIFINDESKEYGDILNNKEWSKADLSDDPELKLYRAEDIVAGGHSALYDALRYKERTEKDELKSNKRDLLFYLVKCAFCGTGQQFENKATGSHCNNPLCNAVIQKCQYGQRKGELMWYKGL